MGRYHPQWAGMVEAVHAPGGLHEEQLVAVGLTGRPDPGRPSQQQGASAQQASVPRRYQPHDGRHAPPRSHRGPSSGRKATMQQHHRPL